MKMNASLQKIDHSALRVNQVTIILLSLIAFLLNAPWLVVLVTAFMLIGTMIDKPGFLFIYRQVLKPAGLVKPQILLDNPEPHRFAQGFGSVVMAAGSLALWAGLQPLGWALVWLVIILAALNAFAGFCAGCAVYYWLNRIHIPGFRRTPPAGTIPGMRPKALTTDES
jgi:hypothetical protein